MTTRNSLCLIIPYWGKFPPFFTLFLQSCKNNPSIDWLFITDNQITEVAANIRVLKMSFDDLKILLKQKFGFPVALGNAYKLCDLKPAYGYIFENEINGYDFWGHCDVDLIFGDIRKFLKNSVFQKYDKILTCGHLSIFRNNYDTNRWFMTLPPIDSKYSYDKIFQYSENLAFDEFGGKESWGGMVQMIRNCNIPIYDEMDFDDIRQTQKSFYSRRLITGKPYTLKELSKMPSYYSYCNGKLFRHIMTPEGEDISESLYVHFQKRNMQVAENVDSNDFIIVPNIFLPSITNINDVWKRSRYTSIYLPYLNRRFHNLIRKIKKILKGKRYV